jgi:hypothetical protein
MDDELADAWAAQGRLLIRLYALEEIAERLAATAADPQAVADYWRWRAQDAERPPAPEG